MSSRSLQDRLRVLPSVDEILGRSGSLLQRFPRSLVVEEARRVLDEMRRRIRSGESVDPDEAVPALAAALEALERPSLRRVINATGVVLHTNLGRAPLAAFSLTRGYSNLEFDLASGRRGKRDVHTAGLLERLLGVPAIAVNNNAAAVYLALNELASGYEVVISRGELIEIGESFRIPDIMRAAGVVLREVGTTNRTRIADYRDAISERTRLLLRVHPSNFRIQGFTSRPALPELVALGRERGIPVYEDLGSGCMADLRAYGIDEPLAGDSLRAGVDLVSFSGDKLLGGPQAGLLAGRPDLVERLRRNPMFRALRLDKLILQALEVTLRHLLLERYDEIPALRMIRLSAAEIRTRAQALAACIPGATVIPGESVIGGGSTPEQTLPTWLIAIGGAGVARRERLLRRHQPPVVARISGEQLLLDLRSVQPEEESDLLAALAWTSVGGDADEENASGR